MPSHIGQELVPRMVRLRSLRHSQRTIAYMLGMTQGAVSEILRRHRETGDTGRWPCADHSRVTTYGEHRSLVRVQLGSCFQSLPSLQSQWETTNRRPPSRENCSMEAHKRRYPWLPTSKGSCRDVLYCHDGQRLVSVQARGKRLDDCVNETHGNRTSSVMVWVAIHHGAKSSWCSSVEPTTVSNMWTFWGIPWFLMQGQPFRTILCLFMTMLLATPRISHGRFPRSTAGWGHALASKLTGYEPHQTKWPTIHDMANQSDPAVTGCPTSMGFSDTGKYSGPWSTVCPMVWLHCRSLVVDTLNIKWCTQKSKS